MTNRRLFLSYPRQNEAPAQAIANELTRFGQDVWMDTHLSGGQEWWDTVLAQIRGCDCFVFLVNDRSLGSKACLAELEYAHALGKVILPISIASKVHDALLPPYLARTQRVEASDPAQATHGLARALLGLPQSPALPDPLPLTPPVPISHLDALAQSVQAESLDQSQQLRLVAELKQRLAIVDEAEAAAELLRQLQRRTDLYTFVADDIKQLLDRVEATSPGTASPPPPPPPPPFTSSSPPPSPPGFATPTTSPPRRKRRLGAPIAVCSVAGSLALVGFVLAARGGGHDDRVGPATTTTTLSPTTTTSPAPATTEPPPTTTLDPLVDLGQGCLDGNVYACDGLANLCMGGDGTACNALFLSSEVSSGYEALADCGLGDYGACDDLYWATDPDTQYELFGSTCGNRVAATWGHCEETYS